MSTPNEIRTCVYSAGTAPLFDTELYEKAFRAVSEARRKQVDRLRFQKDRCLALGAECLLMLACRDFGVNYENERIISGEGAKPVFAGCPLHFNLSHSGERVMCIMSEFPVGCDVEKLRPVKPGIAERYFSPAEVSALEACKTPEEHEALFFRLWTLKESFMKCTGLGFRLSMNTFSVSAGPEGTGLIQSADSAEYVLAERSPGDGYQYAYCIRSRDNPLSINWKQIDLQKGCIY